MSAPSHESRMTAALVRSARREALVVGGIWLAATVWSISACYAWGYGREPGDLKLIWGFPDWVFWGIVVPWGVWTLVSILFGALYVRDDALGADRDDEDELGLGG